MRLGKWIYTIPLRLRSLFGREQVEKDLSDELRDHLERKTEEYVAQGMTQREAHLRARLDMDGIEQTKEKCREARGVNWIQDFVQDLHYGTRTLRKSPGFTIVAVLTLALGIGANTAIFTVFNAVILRPLPLLEPDRIVRMWHTSQGGGIGSVSYLNFEDWQAQGTLFSGMAAYLGGSFNLTRKGGPERIPGAFVSVNYIDVMGMKPLLGRAFLAGEDKPGNNRVALIGEGLWNSLFDRDPELIHKTISLNEEAYAVVGIVPANFHFPDINTQIWVPLVPDDSWGAWNRGNNTLQVVGRLKPSLTVDQARAQMDSIAIRLAKLYPDPDGDQGVRLTPLQESMVGDVRAELVVLLSAVGFLFLVAGVNIANLFLTRAAVRQREFALRRALGARRWGLVRQFLAEGFLISGLGGAVGWMLAIWIVQGLLALNPEPLPRRPEIRTDAHVLFFVLFAVLVSSLIISVAGALKAFRSDVQESLKEGVGTSAGSLRVSRTHGALVIAEVAIALTLVAGAGLLMKSFWLLRQVDPGFKPDHALTLRLSLPQSKYAPAHPVSSFYEPMLEKVEALPGVEAAGLATLLPIQQAWTNGSFQIEDRPTENGFAELRGVSANFYRALGISLVSGRYFTAEDSKASPHVTIINEAVVRSYFSHEDPIGRHIRIAGSPWYTIVGVVKDVHQAGLAMRALREIDVPYSQWPPTWPDLTREMSLVVRTRVEPSAITSAVREAILQVDQDQPAYRVMTMDGVISESLSGQRFDLILISAFASVALLLAALGTYAVLAYNTKQRTREIGVRIALGATKGNILRLVVGQGLRFAVFGVALGLGGAFGLTRFLASLLYQVKPYDLATFAAVSFVLLFVSFVASYLPARRAMRVDPMVALRYE